MTGELFINNKDAWTTWGVRMGDGFLDALDTMAPMKDYIENSSRAKNGKQVLTTYAKVDSRQITLTFTIEGQSETDYRVKKKSFETELQKGFLTIKVPDLSDDTYKLIYTGQNISYALSLTRRFSKFSAKFEEPDPTDRS